MDQIPPEVFSMILTWIDIKEVVRCKLVSTRWHTLVVQSLRYSADCIKWLVKRMGWDAYSGPKFLDRLREMREAESSNRLTFPRIPYGSTADPDNKCLSHGYIHFIMHTETHAYPSQISALTGDYLSSFKIPLPQYEISSDPHHMMDSIRSQTGLSGDFTYDLTLFKHIVIKMAWHSGGVCVNGNMQYAESYGCLQIEIKTVDGGGKSIGFSSHGDLVVIDNNNVGSKIRRDISWYDWVKLGVQFTQGKQFIISRDERPLFNMRSEGIKSIKLRGCLNSSVFNIVGLIIRI